MSQHEESKSRWREWFSELVAVANSAPTRKFKQLLRRAADRDVVDEEALDIIYGALQVTEMHARDIMIPRKRMKVVSDDWPIKRILDYVIKNRHSRYPVIGDDEDDVKGILHAKDLVPWLRDGENLSQLDLRDIIRPASRIPGSKRLNTLFREFRENRSHMVMVMEEYGHVGGLLTIEDVLEMIVGDIEDEHDSVDDEEFIEELASGSYRLQAETPIEEFNSYFETNFPNSNYDTVAGMVVSKLGHVPSAEETISVNGFDFKVIASTNRRIRLLEVSCPSRT